MIPSNFEARRFGDEHQAESLAQWCGGTVLTDDSGSTFIDAGVAVAWPGDWIIRLPDGTFRVDQPGNTDGYCTDCGELVWWQDQQLVNRDGRRWCFGLDDIHAGMTHWHALPGMSQYVVRSADGQVCHCLARDEPHIHLTVTEPEDARLREVYRNMTPDERDSVLREMARELAEGGAS